jgi:hypothetical protein
MEDTPKNMEIGKVIDTTAVYEAESINDFG